MSSTGIQNNVTGKGLAFPSLKSLFRGTTTIVVGGVYMLCEDVVTDDASVTLENSNADAGSKANVRAVTTAAAAGITNAVAGEAAVFILAMEAAASGGFFRGIIEDYYVDCLVTTTASRLPRCTLYPVAAAANLSEAKAGIGSPAIGRLVQDVGTLTAALAKVHFCGFPGGFGVGPGTT